MLIKKTSDDLAVADQKRRDDFKVWIPIWIENPIGDSANAEVAKVIKWLFFIS